MRCLRRSQRRDRFKPAERDDPRYYALAKKWRILPADDA